MWPVVALAALQGGMGYLQAKQQQKQQMAQNLAAAAQTRNSPWTEMGPGQIQTGAGSPALAGIGGGLSGGMSGYMMGKNIEATDKANALNAAKATPPPAPAEAGAQPYSSGSFEEAQQKIYEDQLFKKQGASPWTGMNKPSLYNQA